MTQVMHQACQYDTSLILSCEWQLFTRQGRNLVNFVLLTKSIHLHLTKVGCSTTMLESIVRCSWEHIVVRPELENVFESLHCWLVDKGPAIGRQSNWAVNYVLHLDLLGWSHCLWVNTVVLFNFEITRP